MYKMFKTYVYNNLLKYKLLVNDMFIVFKKIKKYAIIII